MRILVIGQSGQVANALSRVAQNLPNINCVCMGRPEVDISDTASITNALDKIEPDLVINASAFTAVDKAEKEKTLAFAVNATGVGILAKKTAERRIPLVHLSTDYVFSGDKPDSYLEHDATGPTGIYGASKLAGEKLIRLNNHQHIIIRTAWVFDKTGSNFPKTMLSLADSRSNISVVSDQIGNPTDAEEIANALFCVAGKIRQAENDQIWGTYHFAGPKSINWANFARMIMKTSIRFEGPGASIQNITTADYPTEAKRPSNSRLGCGNFLKTFGYSPIPLEASIERHMPDWITGLTSV